MLASIIRTSAASIIASPWPMFNFVTLKRPDCATHREMIIKSWHLLAGRQTECHAPSQRCFDGRGNDIHLNPSLYQVCIPSESAPLLLASQHKL
jgi:hypothetical protein